MEQEKKESSFEIDISSLIKFLLGKSVYILLSAVILAAAFMLYSMFVITPKYQSSTEVYVLMSEGNKATYSDVQLATSLTKDYEALIVSRSVTNEVISDLKLSLTNEQLAKMITVTALKDTRILRISVSNSDPYLARDIANSVREVASKQIVSIMNVDAINLVEEANLPTNPYSPSIRKNTAIGGLIGIFISLAILIVVFVLDDKIKSSKDVEDHLGLPVLGVIPIDEKLSKI